MPARGICLERLASITKSTYFFIQKLSSNKFLDLDNDEYTRNSHRYRTRVDANAATLELLGLSCDDEIGRFSSCTSFASPSQITESIYHFDRSILLDVSKDIDKVLSMYFVFLSLQKPSEKIYFQSSLCDRANRHRRIDSNFVGFRSGKIMYEMRRKIQSRKYEYETTCCTNASVNHID